MKWTSVSPERCETNCRYPASRQIAIARSVSVTVPIWLSLISDALAMLQQILRRGKHGPVRMRRAPRDEHRERAANVMVKLSAVQCHHLCRQDHG